MAAGGNEMAERKADPLYWAIAWIIGALSGPGLVIITASIIEADAGGVNEFAAFILFAYLIGMPFSLVLALAWALLSALIAWLAGRRLRWPSVVIGGLVPALFVSLDAGPGGPDATMLAAFMLSGVLAALAGLAVANWARQGV